MRINEICKHVFFINLSFILIFVVKIQNHYVAETHFNFEL